MKPQPITIIVPVKNESPVLEPLVTRIDATCRKADIPYTIVCVDDNSTDDSVDRLLRLAQNYPIRIHRKQGKPGKAYSILEGVAYATTEYVLMIDSDLQYAPEAIPAMVAKVPRYGVVIANRKVYKASKLRRFLSRVNAYVFGYLLHNLEFDVQSGLKLFRRDIIDHIDLATIRAWSFDIPLLHTARELGFAIGSIDISFELRKNGTSSIRIIETAYQIAHSALAVKLQKRKSYQLAPPDGDSMRGAGVAHRRKRYITHSTLPHHLSALVTFKPWQKLAIVLCAVIVSVGLVLSPLRTAIAVVGALSAIYFLDVLFNLYLVIRSLHHPPEISVPESELAKMDERTLPIYTILCPLYHEAHVVPQFIDAVGKLDWPKAKLECILILEEDDKETINEVNRLALPTFIRVLVVPDTLPKTKPKACNYGLAHARGQYVVVYDAEDIPDPSQLKTAYAAFGKVPAGTVCLQAKLNFYNPHHNLLTKLFTAEYSLWFDMVLTGLQSIETSIPLGGTSNHFKTDILRKLHGWDAFNVTEDCDLGSRLFKAGYKTAVIDSVTLEEANSKVGNWLRQRSRWIKGYIQTYFVHMRDPIRFAAHHGRHAFIFQLVVGGKIAFMFINPILWLATVAYFTLYAVVGPTIESLYPRVIFYMAITSGIFGNFLFLYYYMIGSARHGHWSVIKYVYLVPFYWLMVSVAAVVALIQLIVKPHYWEKTHHGFHLAKKKMQPIGVRVRPWKLGSGLKVPQGLTPSSPRWAFVRNLSSGFTQGSVLIAASIVGNILNFLYNAYLGRRLTLEQFGVIGLITSLLYLAQIAFVSISSTISHKSAVIFGKYGKAPVEFWYAMRQKIMIIALFFFGLWLGSVPILAALLRVEVTVPLLFAPILVFGPVMAVDTGFLSGMHQFTFLAMVVLTEGATKLGMAVAAIEFGVGDLAYAAIPISILAGSIIAFTRVRHLSKIPQTAVSNGDQKFPQQFFRSMLVLRASAATFLGFDYLIVRAFVTPTEAGQYALLSLVGKMIFFLGSLFSQFIVPVVSKKIGEGQEGKKQFRRLLGLTMIASGSGVFLFGVFGSISVPMLFGDNAASIVHLLPTYALTYGLYTVAQAIVSYHQVRGEYAFSGMSLLAAVGLVTAISLQHGSLAQIVNVIFIASLSFFVTSIVLHVFLSPIRTVVRNIADLLELFGKIPKVDRTPAGALRILVFNWRDTKHVWSGGAEVYLHELAKRWVSAGNHVTMFCGNDGKHPRNQVVDGVQVIRRGGFYMVYVWAIAYYLLRFRGKFDVIIDSQNGIPFFTPLYARIPSILVIHHVHQEVFRRHLRVPFSTLAAFVESNIAPFVYRGCQIVTVSASSKTEIQRNLRFGNNAQIDVINPGVDSSVYHNRIKKTTYPAFLYLGRLKPYKQIDVAIRAFALVRKYNQTARLTIAGEGEAQKDLANLVKELGIERAVRFTGRVTENEKVRLFGTHWAAIHPSSIEGWGLTVVEANACGTPVIASNVFGLRDSVVHEKTGLLVQSNNVLSMASAMDRMIVNKADRRSWSKEALQWSKNFSWDKSAQGLEQIITRELAYAKRSALSYLFARRSV